MHLKISSVKLKEENCLISWWSKHIFRLQVDMKQKKQVDFGTAKDFCDGWKLPYLETSARCGTNVDLAFTRLIIALKRQHAPWKQLYNFT